MANLPNSLKKVALFLERLPGIGEKTANRLAFYFLRLPNQDLKEFAQSIVDLKIKKPSPDSLNPSQAFRVEN
ncbi:MAG: hypothetical protein WCJ54_09285 [Actinomycetota bacterium]